MSAQNIACFTYNDPRVIAQRRALAEELANLDQTSERAERVCNALCARIGGRPYNIDADGSDFIEWFASAADAIDWAQTDVNVRAHLDDGYSERESTEWFHTSARDLVTGDLVGEFSIGVDPDEPDCAEGLEHDWQTVRAISVNDVTDEICSHCHRHRLTDWSSEDRDTGERCMSITFADADGHE